MKIDKKRRTMLLVACLSIVVVVAGLIMASAADNKLKIPDLKEAVWGKTVYSNEKGAIDASNLEEGYISAKYTGGKKVAIKVQITKKDLATYTYNLDNTGKAEIFPISEGDGEYTVRIYEKNDDTGKYALAYGTTLTVKLRNALAPFLYPNQYVNFTASSQVAKKAAELTTGVSTELDKVGAIYNFVVGGFTYDTELAKTVQSGYIPNVDAVLSAKKGICFDYSAVMCAMLRSQGIPARLEVGYAGTVYHAWINVYIEDMGWIDKAIYFDGYEWKLMDPTFASTGNSSSSVMEYIGNGDNYSVKYVY